MKEAFAAENLEISRSTVWKLQRKLLSYSYKRVCQYVPRNMGNKFLRRIAFVEKFIHYLQDKKTAIFILDEMGIGTKPLRHYGYSKVG